MLPQTVEVRSRDATTGTKVDLTSAVRDPIIGMLFHPLRTGDPVYANLNPRVHLRFSYQFESNATHSIDGVTHAYAIMRDVNGWTHVMPWPDQAFTGDQVLVTPMDVDVVHLFEGVQVYEAVTGHVPHQYTAALVFRIDLHGTLHDQPYNDTVTHVVTFRVLPPNEMFVETPETRLLDDVRERTLITDAPFHQQQDKALAVTEVQPNEVDLLGVHLEVSLLRVIAAAVTAIAMVLTAIILLLQRAAARRGEAFLIRARYGEHLVLVDATEAAHVDRPIARLSSIEDLVRLAHQNGSPIFLQVQSDRHTYLVREGEHLYSHVIEPTAA